MYYPFFLAYMAAGFVICLGVFFWALNRSQFDDQRRARFLPLDESPLSGPVRLTRAGRWHAAVLLTMAGSGLLATALAIALSLYTAGGR